MTDADLGSNRKDAVVAVLKGAAGMIPFAGGIIGEILGNFIPNQRIDRIASFAAKLNEKLSQLEGRFEKERLTAPEFVDLFEDAALLAARALSDERREQLASVLANSLTAEARSHLYQKRLLQILGELNDAEVIILQSYNVERSYDDDFQQKHAETLRGPEAFIGADQAELDRVAVHETYKQHLVQLGLLAPTFRRPKRGEFPEFDQKTGMIKASSWHLSDLGQLLLRQMDLLPPDAA